MNKYVMFFVVMLSLLVVAPFIMLAQNNTISDQEISILQMLITSTISIYVITFASFVTSVLSITAIINKKMDNNGWIKQKMSWIVAMVVAMVAFGLDLGLFAPMEWWQAIFAGIAGGLVTNGVYDIPVVHEMLLKLKLEKIPLK